MTSLGFTNVSVWIWVHLWVQYHWHMASNVRFVGWTKRPTCEIDVFINVSWVPNSKMVILKPIICSIVAIMYNWTYFNCTCGYWSLIVGACTSMGDPWWGSISCSMDVSNVGRTWRSICCMVHYWVAQWCLYPHIGC